jgi:hypothetical protein
MLKLYYSMNSLPAWRRVPASAAAQPAPLTLREFADRACRFIHGDLAVRLPSGVGSGNGGIAGAFSELVPQAREFIRVLTQRQRARVGIAVRPAIDSDCADVALRVKSISPEHSVQLAPDFLLKLIESRGQDQRTAGAISIAGADMRSLDMRYRDPYGPPWVRRDPTERGNCRCSLDNPT